jgi:hypothetical protein
MITNVDKDLLQPLREVGSLEKTQYWDRDDIIVALRAANLRGIELERLFDRASPRTTRIYLRAPRMEPDAGSRGGK